MIRPERTANGDYKPHHILPLVLERADFRYHPNISGLKPSADDKVVMWTEGAVHWDGYQAGTHDGMRDGEHGGRTDMRQNHVVYCLLSDWIAAGNDDFSNH